MKAGLPDVGHQLLQHRLALGVGDRVEVGQRRLDVVDLVADRVGRRPHVGAVGVELAADQELRPRVGELGGLGRGPGRGPGGERLVEPEVVPPLHGHEVAEPHVRHLVEQRDRRLRALGVGRRGAEEVAVTPRHAGPVLHRAAHVGDEDLVVVGLGERLAELLAEERQPALGEVAEPARVPVERRPQRLPAVEAEVVVAAGLAHLVERAGVDDHDVRRERGSVREGPHPRAAGEVADRLGPHVREHRPRLRGGDGEAVGGLEVGLVEAAPQPPGVVALERGPHVDLVVGRVDGAQDAGRAGHVRLAQGERRGCCRRRGRSAAAARPRRPPDRGRCR